MFAFLAVFFFVAGAFFRRWWGGWQSPSHWTKLPVGFVVSAVVAVICLRSEPSAAVFGLALGATWLNPFHSYGMGMGFSADDKLANKSTLKCVAVMSGSYGFCTTVAALAAFVFGANPYVLAYAPTGILVSVPYLMAWEVYYRFPKIPNVQLFGATFIDGATAVGECFLGAILLSGLPLIVFLLG